MTSCGLLTDPKEQANFLLTDATRNVSYFDPKKLWRSKCTLTKRSSRASTLLAAGHDDVWLADGKHINRVINDANEVSTQYVKELEESILQLEGFACLNAPSLLGARCAGALVLVDATRAEPVTWQYKALDISTSRQVPGELFAVSSFEVVLLNPMSQKPIARMPTNEPVDVCVSGSHPRMAYVGGDRILRADFRAKSVDIWMPANPPTYYAGLVADWEGGCMHQWGALACSLAQPHLLAAVSLRSKALVVYDTRWIKAPVAEWALPRDDNASYTHIEWNEKGDKLLAYAPNAQHVAIIERTNARSSLCVGACSQTCSCSGLYSNMSLIDAGQVQSACFANNDTILVATSKGALTAYTQNPSE